MSFSRLLKIIPEEIRSLFFIKMFTTYSYATLYASLVLYMTSKLGYSDKLSAGVVGVFISLNFLLHFIGGYSGGKLVSNRLLFVLGMLLEITGLIIIQFSLFIGLGVFLTGCGVYATSINAIMTQRYAPEDNRRELASFWLYSAMNIGFFIGHAVSGYFHLKGDYSSLFITALMTSIFSLTLMIFNWGKFEDRTTEHVKLSGAEKRRRASYCAIGFGCLVPIIISCLTYERTSSNLVIIAGVGCILGVLRLALKQQTKANRNKLFAFLILMLAGIAFWSLFFIGPMGLTLFIVKYVDTNLLGLTIPPQWFNNINTAIIILGGPLLGTYFQRKRERGIDLSVPVLFSWALILIGVAFAIIPLGMYFANNNEPISIWWIIVSYIFQTIGELFLSPVGVAMIGQLAPRGKQGLLLGVWSMVSGVASMISKHVSQVMTVPSFEGVPHNSYSMFSSTFNLVGWSAITCGILLFSIAPFVKKLMGGE